MLRFVELFRELGKNGELLRKQVDSILVDRLQSSWVKVRIRTPRSLSLVRTPLCHTIGSLQDAVAEPRAPLCAPPYSDSKPQASKRV